MKWRPLVVLILGVFFFGSLYLGFSLQSQAETSELTAEAFIQQLNVGGFERIERSGTNVLGETATGNFFAADFPGNDSLEVTLSEAGAEREPLQSALESSTREPLGIILARQLLWVGPLLLLVCLVFLLLKGQGTIEDE